MASRHPESTGISWPLWRRACRSAPKTRTFTFCRACRSSSSPAWPEPPRGTHLERPPNSRADSPGRSLFVSAISRSLKDLRLQADWAFHGGRKFPRHCLGLLTRLPPCRSRLQERNLRRFWDLRLPDDLGTKFD